MAAKPNSAAPPTVTVALPRALLLLFPEGQSRIELSASNVAELIAELDARWPGMGDRLRDSTPRIRKHLNIFVDGRRAALDTPLKPGSQVYVLTAMSGG